MPTRSRRREIETPDHACSAEGQTARLSGVLRLEPRQHSCIVAARECAAATPSAPAVWPAELPPSGGLFLPGPDELAPRPAAACAARGPPIRGLALAADSAA